MDRIITGITEIDLFWPHFEPLVARACEVEGEYTAKDVYARCKAKEMQLWVSVYKGAPEAVMVSEIMAFPARKVAVIVLMAGENAKIVKRFIPTFMTWARNNGCDTVRIQGREGWKRLLPDFKQTAIVMERSL